MTRIRLTGAPLALRAGHPSGAHARRSVISPDRKRARRGPSASTSAPLASTPATLPVTRRAVGQQQAHRLALVRRGDAAIRRRTGAKPSFAYTSRTAGKLGQQAASSRLRSIGGALRPAIGRKIGDRDGDVLARGRRQPDVEADADDGRRRTERVAVQLDQDAADLEVPVDEVVRPLERDVLEALGLERANDGDADRERESGQEARALLELPAQREREAARRRSPSTRGRAARGRPICHSAASATRWTSRRCARRISSEDVDSIWSTTSTASGNGIPRAAAISPKRARTLLGVQKVRRLEQPVAAALDAFEGEPRRPGVLQDLRNAGARQPHLGGQVLAGMELSIGKLAQQRESERSEHL